MIKIVSNGTIPNGMTKEDFLSGKTHPVNEELIKIFLQCHIVEQTGHGVPKIIKKYGIEAYDFGTSTITVSIPFDRCGFCEDVQNATNNATKAKRYCKCYCKRYCKTFRDGKSHSQLNIRKRKYHHRRTLRTNSKA